MFNQDWLANKNVVALVPCRAGSERVKEKNTRNFAGESLIKVKLKQLLNVPEISQIIVSTNDPLVIEIVKKFNHPKLEIHHRHPYYASSQCTNDEFIEYFGRVLEIKGHLLFTHVTNPFINEKTYSSAIKEYFSKLGEYDSLASVKEMKEYLWDAEGNYVSHTLQEGRWPRTQTLKPIYMINSGIFIIPFELMKKKKDRVGERVYLFHCNKIESFDIDWPEDFEVAESIWKILNAKNLRDNYGIH